MSSTACWNSDARTPSASPERGRGRCVHPVNQCNNAAGQRRFQRSPCSGGTWINPAGARGRVRAPEGASDRGDGVAEGRLALVIPRSGSGTDRTDRGAGQFVGPHRDQGKQAEQRWRRAQDGEIGPLPLSFHAQMGAGFLERRSMRQRETNQPRILSGVAARSVLRNACGSPSPEGSRTSTQRIGAGGKPEWYQTAVSDATSSSRGWPPYHSATVVRDHMVFGSASTALNVGKRRPFSRGRPICPGRRGGAGANRLASIRNRVTRQAWRRNAAIRLTPEKPASATTTRRRPGSQRLACRTAWRAQSTTVLCRRPRSLLQRSEGARTVRNGSAQRRPPSGGFPSAVAEGTFAQGIGTMTMSDSQRRPLARTKWSREERTGSR